MRAKKFDTKLWHWAILLLLAVTWGSSFILMKKGLEVYTDRQVAALRMFIAFIFLLPIAVAGFGQTFKIYWKPLLAVGLLGNGIPAFLFTKAQTGIDSSLAGMLNGLVPLFTLIIGIIWFQIKVSWINIAGIALGFTGAAVLIMLGHVNTETGNISYSFFVIAATICYAITVNTIKKYLKELDAKLITSMAFMFIGPPTGIYLFTTDFINRLTTYEKGLSSFGYIVILAVFGTALAVIVFNYLIKLTTTIFAASVTYVIPVVAIMWGVLDGEYIGVFHFISIGIIMLGVYLVNSTYGRRL